MAWRTAPIVDIGSWTAEYVRRRFALPGTGFKSVYAAYDILLATVYNCTTGQWGVTKARRDTLDALSTRLTRAANSLSDRAVCRVVCAIRALSS